MSSGDTSEKVGRSAKYSDEVYLEAISDLAEGDPDIVTSAANIHTRLAEKDKEITRRAIYNRLHSLQGDGLIECREISPEFHKWKITEAGVEALEEARREDEEDVGGEDGE